MAEDHPIHGLFEALPVGWLARPSQLVVREDLKLQAVVPLIRADFEIVMGGMVLRLHPHVIRADIGPDAPFRLRLGTITLEARRGCDDLFVFPEHDARDHPTAHVNGGDLILLVGHVADPLIACSLALGVPPREAQTVGKTNDSMMRQQTIRMMIPFMMPFLRPFEHGHRDRSG